MTKDYHALPPQEITAIFEALNGNNKCEQYNFEVKKSGNSIDLGQLCGMLNSDGGIIIVGVEEKVPIGSGYNFHPIRDLQAENGKINTQIGKLKQDNSDIADKIDTCCIIESFSYNGGDYPIIKVNHSDVGFVFDGRIYYKIKENKDYLKTRNDIVAFMGKTGDYSTFLHQISSFRNKLVKIRDCMKRTPSDLTVEYLSSSNIEEINKIIGLKSDYIQTKINITLLTENLMNLQNVIKYIETGSPRGAIDFTSMMAPVLNKFMDALRKKDATTVLNDTIDALEKIYAN